MRTLPNIAFLTLSDGGEVKKEKAQILQNPIFYYIKENKDSSERDNGARQYWSTNRTLVGHTEMVRGYMYVIEQVAFHVWLCCITACMNLK